MSQKVGATGKYTAQLTGGSKSRKESYSKNRKGSKNTSDSSMGYHNSSNDGTYSYDYKGSKGGYKRIHGNSVTANTSPMSNNRHSTNK